MSERITIVTGHFGSGKTEFAINYALKEKEKHDKLAIVDLDIINMYFRLRENKDFLEGQGIECISSLVEGNSLDIPALDPSILRPLENKDYKLIIDVGGNPSGARALGRYSNLIKREAYEHIFVLNRNRPETKDLESTLEFIAGIEERSGTKISGLVNNTHFLADSQVEDLYYGDELAKELASELNIPIKYTMVNKNLMGKLNKKQLGGELLEIDLYFRQDWM